jgi:hypothetical protein
MKVITIPISLSNKVIVFSICLIISIIVSGCVSSSEKTNIAGKYLHNQENSTSYLELKADGTCFLYPLVNGNIPVPGFSCTYKVRDNAILVCYPEYQGVCDNWTIVSPNEITGPAGYHAKKAN